MDGYSQVARENFVQHCAACDPDRLGIFARFAFLCFRLRTVDSPETYRHLIQHMVQKFLAKSLVDSSPLAKKYRKVTSEEHINAVAQFLHYGLPCGIEVFDSILFYCLKHLGSEYLFFFLRDGGAGLRDRKPEDMSDALNALVQRVQIPFRVKAAKLKIRNIHRAAAAELERIKKLEEEEGF